MMVFRYACNAMMIPLFVILLSVASSLAEVAFQPSDVVFDSNTIVESFSSSSTVPSNAKKANFIISDFDIASRRRRDDLPGLSTTTEAPSTTTPMPASCPEGSILNRQGFCLCEAAHACSGSECQDGQAIVNINGRPVRLALHYFERDCPDCACGEAACPDSAWKGENGECRCHTQGSTPDMPDYNSACRGSNWCRMGLTEHTQRLDQYVDWFFPTCTECKCYDCPSGTKKDDQGFCRCPNHMYCEGSDECREATQRKFDNIFTSFVVGDHYHYFDATCEGCTCTADALDDFTRTENAAVFGPGGFEENCDRNVVASKCAEECLDSPTCRSFTTHLKENGFCCLHDFEKDQVKPPYGYKAEEGLDWVYYERKDYNPCDDQNGGCDVDYETCTFTPDADTPIQCADRDECEDNNGGCGDGVLCTNNIGAPPTCGDGENSGDGSVCDLFPCESGTCAEAEVACPSDSDGECPQRVCTITCADSPCTAEGSICEERPNRAHPTRQYRCSCDRDAGYGLRPGATNAGTRGQNCRVIPACSVENGGCGNIKRVMCTNSDDNKAICACRKGYTDLANKCRTLVCATACVHGSCDEPFGACACEAGWSGELCDVCSKGSECANQCINCDEATLTCKPGWTGTYPVCSTPVCDKCDSVGGVCTVDKDDNGSFAAPVCTCRVGYGPPGDCSQKVCDFDCANGGTCVDGKCQCQGKWGGAACRNCATAFVRDGSFCGIKCGDGLVSGRPNAADREACDDGNTVAGDGCSPTCQIEKGWSCSTTRPRRPSICRRVDPCANAQCGESSQCVPVTGTGGRPTFYCKCLDGYTRPAQGQPCQPRCAGGRVWDACGPSCENTCSKTCDEVKFDDERCTGGKCICPPSRPILIQGECMVDRSSCAAESTPQPGSIPTTVATTTKAGSEPAAARSGTEKTTISPQNEDSAGGNLGVIIGIVVGLVALIALIFGGVMLARKLKYSSANVSVSYHNDGVTANSADANKSSAGFSNPLYDASGEQDTGYADFTPVDTVGDFGGYSNLPAAGAGDGGYADLPASSSAVEDPYMEIQPF